ncbi:hypothetical protein [Solirubrum puertoriconensis]|uniref:Uncharacterized protein n=1 Tax=Solirubrum puertoriconensis TaxID=1751427 RepID=A0A9X0HN53_SOLP1|nr:hypothetical protein [Solirubrum puertoriconensis]KUG09039.1 hypothetical protein ASU33_19640 [Solirubrum puertoriconensis]
MLASTTELIRYLRRPAEQQEDAVRQALVNAVWLGGSADDARALLAEYRQFPFAATHACLLPVFERHGDASFARVLTEACCPAGELLPDAPAEVLSLVARLGDSGIKPLLVRYAFGTGVGYNVAKHAALGLLHVDCRDLEQQIRAAIEATYRKNLFPEFIPALVCKLPDRAELLARLYQSGTEYCSTDCNAGILLGFSLCGAEGVSYFKQALLSPAWEAHGSGSGTRWYAYLGMQNLGLTFQELYAEIQRLGSSQEQRYAVGVLLALLRLKAGPYSYTDRAPEPFAELYPALFGWESPEHRNNLQDLAATFGREDEADELEALMQLRLQQEVLQLDCTRRLNIGLC